MRRWYRRGAPFEAFQFPTAITTMWHDSYIEPRPNSLTDLRVGSSFLRASEFLEQPHHRKHLWKRETKIGVPQKPSGFPQADGGIPRPGPYSNELTSTTELSESYDRIGLCERRSRL